MSRRTVVITLLVVLLLAVGFGIAYVWQARAALKKAAANRELLGGAAGVVEDAGSLWAGVGKIWSNIRK